METQRMSHSDCEVEDELEPGQLTIPEMLRRAGVNEKIVQEVEAKGQSTKSSGVILKNKKKDSVTSSSASSVSASISGDSLKRAAAKNTEEQPSKKRGRPKKTLEKPKVKEAFAGQEESSVVEIDLTEGATKRGSARPYQVKLGPGLFLEHKQFNGQGRWHVGILRKGANGFDTWITLTDCFGKLVKGVNIMKDVVNYVESDTDSDE